MDVSISDVYSSDLSINTAEVGTDVFLDIIYFNGLHRKFDFSVSLYFLLRKQGININYFNCFRTCNRYNLNTNWNFPTVPCSLVHDYLIR